MPTAKKIDLDAWLVRRIFIGMRPSSPDSCWEWAGSIAKNGYGVIALPGRKQVKAHRAVYAMFYGEPGQDKLVCHSCDNKKCVNPGHLFSGTHLDNVTDMVVKARHSHGSRHPDAKLSDSDVRDIRSSQLPTRDLMRRYGLSKSQVSKIRSGAAWRHV